MSTALENYRCLKIVLNKISYTGRNISFVCYMYSFAIESYPAALPFFNLFIFRNISSLVILKLSISLSFAGSNDPKIKSVSSRWDLFKFKS